MSNKLITTGVQKIKARHGCSQIVFQIDFDHPEAKKTIKEMVLRWDDYLSEDNTFDILLANWVQIASFHCYRNYCESEIDPETYLNDAEDCPMDGSKGISIYRYWFQHTDYDDFVVSMDNED